MPNNNQSKNNQKKDAKKLASLMMKLNLEEDDDEYEQLTLKNQEYLEEVHEIINKYLDKKEDDFFYLASEYVLDNEDPNVFEHFSDIVNQQTETLPVGVEVKKDNGGTEEVLGTAVLFAVPMIFFNADNNQIAHKIDSENLVKGFKQYGLVDPETTIILSSKLYSYENLYIEPSLRRNVLTDLVVLKEPDLPFPSDEVEPFSLSLRFALGCAIIDENHNQHDIFFDPISDAAWDKLDDEGSGWINFWEEQFSTDKTKITTASPKQLSNALYEGASLFRENSLRAVTEQILQSHEAVEAELSLDKNKDKLMSIAIQFKEKQGQGITQFNWYLEEYDYFNLDDNFDDIMFHLTDMGVEVLPF